MATTPNKKSNFSVLPYDKERDFRARDRLVQARVSMLLNHDFWGKVSTRMRLINADEWCPTLATDGRDFYYNSDFVLKLGSTDKVIFGFAHEVLHCIYEHIPRTGARDKQLSNIAQDYVINADLIHNSVGKRIDEIDIVYDKKYYGWGFEQVYEDLMKNVKEINIDKLLEGLLDDHLEPGAGDGDEEGNSGGQDGDDPNVSRRRPVYNAEQRDRMRDEMREAVLQAAQGCKAGSLPLGVQRLVQNLTDPKMDWRQLINMKIPSLAKHDYTYQRFNKKYMQQGIIMPGLNREEAIDVCVGIDTSGSISQKQLEEMLSEVVGLMQMYEEYTLRIWQFDTQVYGYAEFTEHNADELLSYEIKGGGGTDFMVNWTMMKDEGIEPRLFIMFTDGYPWDSWGDPDYCDTLFIINNSWDKGIESPFGNYAYYE